MVRVVWLDTSPRRRPRAASWAGIQPYHVDHWVVSSMCCELVITSTVSLSSQVYWELVITSTTILPSQVL